MSAVPVSAARLAMLERKVARMSSMMDRAELNALAGCGSQTCGYCVTCQNLDDWAVTYAREYFAASDALNAAIRDVDAA